MSSFLVEIRCRTTSLAIGSVVALVLASAPLDVQATESYPGGTKSFPVGEPGCNATATVQIPGTTDLFIGRRLLTADGQLAGVSGPNDCSGGQVENLKNGKIFNRWGLTLDRFDWKDHKFSLIKPVLDTSIDPQTGRSRAIVTGGPMRGLIIRSAYDADIVTFGGHFYVVYECTVENGRDHGVIGTSICLSIYDQPAQQIDMSRTEVIISGDHVGNRSYDAAVPELLAFRGRLYLYWSALTIESGRFNHISVRGVELDANKDVASVKGSGGRLVHSDESQFTTEVWAPDPGEPMSDAAVDLRAVWVSGGSIIAMSSQGGGDCTAPGGTSKGCFRLVIVRSNKTLGDRIFNKAPKVDADELPTNPQEYTRPIRSPDGSYWFIGHYLKPTPNGFSERRPVPAGAFWEKVSATSRLVLFPIEDKTLWPTE